MNSLPSAGRPRWQQMTALVSLSAGGAITGFSFVPKAAADISSPTSMPLNLVALQQSAHSARTAPASDAMLRKAIVNVADYYLRMAQTKTPAEMEAIIWQHDSIDGADHGQSCAAFASLTLELAAQVVGQQSWVSGGGSYPWPLHSWADVRVEPNPDSLGIISIQQDAEAQHRWHPLGDGYRPLPGDWVLFDGHVEVITEDSGGTLRTVGGDSLPNFSVNAHEYRAPLSGAGVVGFVNNGSLPAAPGAAHQGGSTSDGQGSASSGPAVPAAAAASGTAGGLAAIPGTETAAAQNAGAAGGRRTPRQGAAAREAAGPGAARRGATGQGATGQGARGLPAGRPVTRPSPAWPYRRRGPARRPRRQRPRRAATEKDSGPEAQQAGRLTGRTSVPRAAAARGDAAIPGLDVSADLTPGHQGVPYRRHHPSPVRKPVSETRAQQAFISEVAPGALEAQDRYGVPAAVTIAQAIDESGWGQSQLAAQDHNLFGIKGTGPAGSVPMPTQEYVNGQPVSTSASFRVYHNAAESIDDHGRLLARSGYYGQAMAEREHPDKFAAALTGVYATDPNYGANLISLMRRYDLYRYNATHAGPRPDRSPAGTQPGSAAIPGVTRHRHATCPAGRVSESARRDPAADADRQAPADPDGEPGADPDGEPGADPDGQPGSRPGRRARSRPGPPSPGRPARRARTPPGPRPGADRNGQPGTGADACSRAEHHGQRAAARDRSASAERAAQQRARRVVHRAAVGQPAPRGYAQRRSLRRRRTAAPPGQPPRRQRFRHPRPLHLPRPPKPTSRVSPRRPSPNAR